MPTEHDGGVHVVAAGVRLAVDGAAVRHVLQVLQRQGVDVGPERDGPITGADVADHTVTARHHARAEPGDGQFTGDQGGGLEFGV
jgi:hypothetical protein